MSWADKCTLNSKLTHIFLSLSAQQAAFTRPQTDSKNILCASFVVSVLVAKKLKFHEAWYTVVIDFFVGLSIFASLWPSEKILNDPSYEKGSPPLP